MLLKHTSFQSYIIHTVNASRPTSLCRYLDRSGQMFLGNLWIHADLRPLQLSWKSVPNTAMLCAEASKQLGNGVYLLFESWPQLNLLYDHMHCLPSTSSVGPAMLPRNPVPSNQFNRVTDNSLLQQTNAKQLQRICSSASTHCFSTAQSLLCLTACCHVSMQWPPYPHWALLFYVCVHLSL